MILGFFVIRLIISILHQNKSVIVVFLWHISLVINEVVDGTGLGCVGTRKVLEVKAFLIQLLASGKAFSAGIQFRQDIMVAGQDTVDFPNHVDLLVGLLVIIAVAARVAAEFLVEATDEWLTAV
jgi:hypothetical protein